MTGTMLRETVGTSHYELFKKSTGILHRVRGSAVEGSGNNMFYAFTLHDDRDRHHDDH
jgi:hypothetical protein